MEIKCQLDETDEFLLQILLLAQHVSGTIMPIIRSSRVLYKWLLPVVFGAWFSSCRYGVELRVTCPVCGLQPANGSALKSALNRCSVQPLRRTRIRDAVFVQLFLLRMGMSRPETCRG